MANGSKEMRDITRFIQIEKINGENKISLYETLPKNGVVAKVFGEFDSQNRFTPIYVEILQHLPEDILLKLMLYLGKYEPFNDIVENINDEPFNYDRILVTMRAQSKSRKLRNGKTSP